MLKIDSWVLPRPALVAIALLLPKYNRELDPVELKQAFTTMLPPGTAKSKVIEFLRRWPVVFYDDRSLEVSARLLGKARDRVHSWDLEVAFHFDAEQRLVSYSVNECLTFH